MKVKFLFLSLMSILLLTQCSSAQVSLAALEKATNTGSERIPDILQGFHFEYRDSKGSLLWANDGVGATGEIVKTRFNGDPTMVAYIFTNPSYFNKLSAQIKLVSKNNIIDHKSTPSANGMNEKTIVYESAAYRYGVRILSQHGKVYGYNIYVFKK